MKPETGEVWEVWCEDADGRPEWRVTLLVLGPAPEDRVYGKRQTLARCLVLESTEPSGWPPGDVGDWGRTDFELGTSRRLA